MNKDYRILDIKNFEFVDNDNYLIIPANIAEIAKILIKKGYDIIKFNPASLVRLQVFSIFDLDEKTILNEKVLKNICYTTILIQFSEKYKFDTVPKRFYKMKDVNAFICTINYYEENPFRIKEYEELDKEIKEIYNELKKWAITLLDVSNRAN